ncbi:MAG: cyclodeaminase/cyclohydrolase family protein [Ktedonobacterales bacterium]
MMPEQRSLPDFLEALGSNAPAPGGGAASALAGALAAALAEMVANFTVGRPRFQDVEETMRAAVEQSRHIRGELLSLIDEDERAYQAVAIAYRLPKATDEERVARDAAIQVALHGAMQPPLRVMDLSCRAVDLAAEMAAAGNPTVVSDAGCAALLGEAAVRAAALNVLANVVLLHDQDAASQVRMTVAQLEERAAATREHTMAAVHARMGI